MGQASPQPMVITTSAACTLSVVSGLGYSREMSRPISAMAAMTAGLSWSAGWDPAEVTRTRPAAWLSSSAAAIWDRPALWVQTNSTSGMSAMASAFQGSARELGGLFRADPATPDRVDRDRQEGADRAADELGGDESERRRGRDPRVGVGEGPADGDGRVGEGGGGGEPVRRADPGAHRPRHMLEAAGPGQGDDHEQQPGGSNDLAEQNPCAAAVMVGRAEGGLGEHGISKGGPGDGPGDLAGDDGDGLAQAVATGSAAAEKPVGGGDNRVEVRAPGL